MSKSKLELLKLAKEAIKEKTEQSFIQADLYIRLATIS